MAPFMVDRRAKQGGFTLLEVMIALTIFATSSVMLYNQVSSSVVTAERLEQKQLALILVKNQYAKLLLDRKLLPTGQEEEIVDMANGTWTVRTVVKETGNEDLRSVEVSVYDSDDVEEGTAVLTLLRFIGQY